MFCKNCGAQIEEDAKFCTKCGTQTDLITLQVNRIELVQKVEPTAPQKGGFKWWYIPLMIGGTITLMVALMLLGAR